MRTRCILWMVGIACVLWLPGVRIAHASETEEATDWPTVIARLQEEVYRMPGYAKARQELAVAYNNYGVSLSKQGQWEQAVEQFQFALQIDAANQQFTQNLSNTYVNQANEAIQQYQLEHARTLLEQAIGLTPQAAQAYALLGDLEYQLQRLKEARAAWEHALALDSTQPELKQRLERVTKELPVESKLERLWQAYFDVRYEETLERPVGFDIRDALVEARRVVGSDFAYWPKHKIVVLIYTAENFRALRQETPEWVAGQFDGKIRVPMPDHQMDLAEVKQILFHEYTHALVYDLTHGTCPVWLNEGLAEYEGRAQHSAPLTYLVQAHREDRLLPWHDLSQPFDAGRPPHDVALGYQQSHSVVAYLVKRYGWWRIRRILKAIADGAAWEGALAQELQLTLPRLEANWRTWLPEFLSNQPQP